VRILSLLFFISFLFAKPLSIDKAFHSEFIPKQNNIEFILKIANHIHIYKKSIKVLVNNKPIQITLPKAKLDDFGSEIYEKEFKITIPIKEGEVKVTYQGCSDEMVCYAPQTKVYKTTKNLNVADEDKIAKLFNKSIWIILGSFFVFGLLLSLTPCIFPMIPILSGLIVKNLKKPTPLKGFLISLVYVLSMSITYTIAGVLAGLFGSNIQILFQNPYIISLFSLVFVILAFSMFGFFELGLPHSLQTKLSIKSNKAGERGGMLGVGIMGFLSALIVGPCVAPPLAGALIYIGQSGDALLGGSALFVMSIGMGMPLFIIGLGAGKFMPRAGGWMIGVNRVFGVVMLGVAIFMISRILAPNIVLILWGVLAIGSGLYLNPFSKMGNYKEVIFKTLGFILVVFGVMFLIKGSEIISTNTIITKKTNKWKDIKTLNELNKEIKQGKVLVDFTAKWCVACKEYEETTFKDNQVLNEFKNYKLIRIDITNNTKDDKILMKKFGIIGPPVILVFEDSKLKTKIVGYKNSTEFLKLIKE